MAAVPIEIRLVEGRSARRGMVLEARRSKPPVTLGTRAEWIVEDALMAPVHLLFAWNGERLFIGPVGAATVILDGVRVEREWTEAVLGSEIVAGRARLVVAEHRDESEATTEVVPSAELAVISFPKPLKSLEIVRQRAACRP